MTRPEKKSEKIEVRLSYDEKTTLSEIAEQEGRSISELVRGLIARYVAIHTTRLPKKKQWGLMAALLVGGFFAGHLMTYFMAKSHKHDPIYNIEANLEGGYLAFPLIIKEGHTEAFTLETNPNTIELTVRVEKRPEALPRIHMTMCVKMDDGCALLAEPVLVLNPHDRARTMLMGKDGKSILIEAKPNRRRKNRAS